MELTPIYARGTRTKRKLLGPGEILPSRKRKTRPVTASVGPSSLGTKSDLKRRDPRRSQIEQLPSEILQIVFSFCDSVDLAFASAIIGIQLSDHSTLIQAALRFLWRSPSERSVGPESDDPAAMSSISKLLQCRWMSWDTFREVVERCQKLGTEVEDVDIGKIDFTDFDNTTIPYLRLNAQVRMPEKLLRGPWQSKDRSFLHYLCLHKLSVDWDHSTVGEVATAGLSKAIAEGCHVAAACLLANSIGVTPSTEHLRWAVLQHGCNRSIVFYLLEAAVRVSVRSRSDGQPVVPADSINFRDPSLWSWAGRAVSRGDQNGAWLKNALRSATDVSSAHSHWDSSVFDEYRNACGRESDHVEQVPLPR